MKSQSYKLIIGLSIITILMLPSQVGAWGEFAFEYLTNKSIEISKPVVEETFVEPIESVESLIIPETNISTDKQAEVLPLFIDTQTLQKGYTVEAFDNNFRVGIFPEVLSEETNITFKKLTPAEEWVPAPFGKIYVTPIYEFDISNTDAFKNKEPLIVEIKYPDDNNRLKEVYFWNKPTQEWVILPTELIPERQVMRAVIHLPYARLAVLTYPQIMSEGVASWYAYKSCDCAASPDYPKGSLLKVTNLYNNKSVVVKVNDFGPERNIHPDRVIDLDVTAFKQIANKRIGLIDVIVEPVEIVASD